MSRIQQVRDALAAGPIPFRDLHLKIGGDDVKLRQTLYGMTHAGEVKVGDDEDKTVKLLRSTPQGKRKKPAHKSLRRFQRRMNKGKHVKRPYKKLAQRVAGSSLRPHPSSLPDLALANYLGAGALLRQAIEDQVDGLDDNFALRNAVANHERAEQILDAARPA